jgi:hypothetical protein
MLQAPIKKFPKSTGQKGDLDSRRWVVLIFRNNGAQEAQFPLPVTVNTQRIAFDRDEPVVAPAYYLDTIDNCVLPKHEQTPKAEREATGDDSRMVEIKYVVEVLEIDEKWQHVDKIMEFVRLVNSEDCPVDMVEFKKRIRLGQVSFNKHNYAWSEKVNGQSKSKQRASKSANSNT